jgi:hypothetical protein
MQNVSPAAVEQAKLSRFMELKRRFIFHGDAVAIGGTIVRPDDIVLDPKCASALPVTGGRTSCKLKGMKFGKHVSFASASTLAEGFFDDRKLRTALTRGKVREEELTSTTTVRAEVLGFQVGIEPRLTVRRVRGSLVARSPVPAEEETVVRSGADVAIDGVAIDEHRLIVELNKGLFQEQDTFTKLRRAAADAAFVERNASNLLVGAIVRGEPQTGLIEVRGTIHGTIVRSIRWSGKPFPGATIDGNLVTVPELGRIYFGEILISRDSRRLTMLRLELGSPAGGSMAAADVQDNGGWSP